MALPSSHSLRLITTTLYEKPQIFSNNEIMSVHEKEKQISVDPISLRETPSLTEKGVDSVHILPPVSTPKPAALTALSSPPPLLPAKPKFLSCSLPNSANSSPRFSAAAALLKRKWRNHFESQASPRQVQNLSTAKDVQQQRQRQQQLVHFRRSKSCGERKAYAPSDVDFDLWEHNKPNNAPSSSSASYNVINNKKDLDMMISFPNTSFDQTNKKVNSHNNNKKDLDMMISFPKTSFDQTNKKVNIHNNDNVNDSDDARFKCGALCLFLPGFGKAKPVRPANREEEKEEEEAAAAAAAAAAAETNGMSRTVSLEKFECGSWASSGATNVNDVIEDGDSMNHYFDLPLELIRTGGNDAHSPVASAFVFDKADRRSGVLKDGSARASSAAARHVRFSVSSTPTTSYPSSPAASCITPRLRKAREDFYAFLEAQSA